MALRPNNPNAKKNARCAAVVLLCALFLAVSLFSAALLAMDLTHEHDHLGFAGCCCAQCAAAFAAHDVFMFAALLLPCLVLLAVQTHLRSVSVLTACFRSASTLVAQKVRLNP
ncbi:MAG: hypothetical protein LBB67_00285 [Oscillospiraceae bacterium]|jgi:hypothetical protein|nr:hypothetical protein [Oscillospiraceae bacterium]